MTKSCRRAGGRPVGASLRSGLPALALMCGLPAGSLAMGGVTAVHADPLPLPQSDFQLKANLRAGAQMELAHSQGKMRVEMSKPGAGNSIIGIFDLKGRRMLMLVPSMPNMAVEMEIPPEYAVGAMVGEGERTGQSAQVAGEACDLWKVDARQASSVGPTLACITADGIALRTEMEIKGKTEVVYEVTNLARGPQPPSRFQLPAGTQVIRPKAGHGLLPALLGKGGADAAKGQ